MKSGDLTVLPVSYFLSNLRISEALPSLTLWLLCSWGLPSFVKCFGANCSTNGCSLTARLSSYTADVEHVSPFPSSPLGLHNTYTHFPPHMHIRCCHQGTASENGPFNVIYKMRACETFKIELKLLYIYTICEIVVVQLHTAVLQGVTGNQTTWKLWILTTRPPGTECL